MKILYALIELAWASFWIYWFISAFGVKKNTSHGISRFFGIRLVLWVVAFTLFRSTISSSRLSTDFATGNIVVVVIGFVVILSGLSFAIWARLHLGNNWGGPMSLKQSPDLVTSGPYRYVRHPIYTGVLLAMLGTAVATNLFWLVVFVLAGAFFIYSATVEEKRMTQLFPNDYPQYRKTSHMLIPFVL